MEMEMKRRGFDIREPPQSPGLPSFVSLPAVVGAPVTSSPAAPVGETSAFPVFDVGEHVKLVPPFREAEWVAGALRWPKEMWALLLQCKLIGKAQEVCASLSVDTSLDYDVVKAAVLRAVTVHGSVCSFCVRLCCGPARCACQRCLVTVHLTR